ncbi:B2 protein [Sesamum angolense]|uniref:B2 protein n=1 Tax=Sesamum angolense TaxID=2727404 RepID=A0AAE1WA51_9LAMI|nr:B2 protein [Sesamum angolense]
MFSRGKRDFVNNIEGLLPRYRDSVRAITPGLPLFLHYSTHQLHGIFEAARFGGTNVNPSVWEDKKNPGESRFSVQETYQKLLNEHVSHWEQCSRQPTA